MEKITIEIETVNDAFHDSEYAMEGEVSAILANLSHSIGDGRWPEIIRDLNGNTVGKITIK